MHVVEVLAVVDSGEKVRRAKRVAAVGTEGGIPSNVIALTRENEEGIWTEWSR